MNGNAQMPCSVDEALAEAEALEVLDQAARLADDWRSGRVTLGDALEELSLLGARAARPIRRGWDLLALTAADYGRVGQ